MHPSIDQYLAFLHTQRRTPATLKVIQHDLAHFVAWWEGTRQRTFDPARLRHEDLRDWRMACRLFTLKMEKMQIALVFEC